MIEVGDTVELHHNANFHWPCPGGIALTLTCEVLHTPCDTGDYWHFRDSDTGTVFAQNPMSPNLDKIVLLKSKYLENN